MAFLVSNGGPVSAAFAAAASATAAPPQEGGVVAAAAAPPRSGQRDPAAQGAAPEIYEPLPGGKLCHHHALTAWHGKGELVSGQRWGKGVHSPHRTPRPKRQQHLTHYHTHFIGWLGE